VLCKGVWVGVRLGDAVEVACAGIEQRTRDAAEAVDTQRRRRRERAVPQTPAPPARLGDSFQRRSLLRLPAESDSRGAGDEDP
jgi:hypothetical protein